MVDKMSTGTLPAGTTDPICCPGCRSPLPLPDGDCAAACPVCGRAFVRRQGILDFLPGDRFYWGEVQQEQMVAINDQAEADGWFNAFRAHLGGDATLMRYLFDPIRLAALFHCYDEDRRERCLDLGSGWGPISFGLSRLYRTVYSLDGVLERLRFQAIRARQERVLNLRLLRSRMLELPFAGGSMDLVMVNGLLEWIGLGETDEPPASLQLRFLKEVRRVLHPGGSVMIGIENRFGAQFFLGGRDHSGLRFTSLVPRRMADFMVKHTRRSPQALVFSGAEQGYRTLTYSHRGYGALLKSAGFGRVEIYWTYPGYNYPHVSGPADGMSIHRYLHLLAERTDSPLGRLFFGMAGCLPASVLQTLIRSFSPCFLIVAGREEADGRLQRRITGNLTPGRSSFLRLSTDVRPELKTTFLLLENRQVRRVRQVSLVRAKDQPLDTLQVGEQDVMAGHRIRYGKATHLDQAARWLLDHQRSTRTGTWQKQQLLQELGGLEDRVRSVSDGKYLVHLDEFSQRYLALVEGTELPRVAEHGDFTLTNLFLKDGRIQPIDWEYARSQGHPFMDAGALCLDLLDRGRSRTFRGRQLLTRFVRIYEEQTRLVIHLSPAYYILRIVARAAERHGVSPAVVLYAQKWLSRLPLALGFSASGGGDPG